MNAAGSLSMPSSIEMFEKIRASADVITTLKMDTSQSSDLKFPVRKGTTMCHRNNEDLG